MNIPEAIQAARSEFQTAARLAGDRSHVMAAEITLRMAQLGHVTKVSVSFSESPEAVEAFAPILREVTGATLDASDTLRPLDLATNANGSVREACAGHSGEGSGVPEDGPSGETRSCGACGSQFRVNLRHSRTHRFCKPACRSKARRRVLLPNWTDEP
jgi:hypothetical protein